MCAKIDGIVDLERNLQISNQKKKEAGPGCYPCTVHRSRCASTMFLQGSYQRCFAEGRGSETPTAPRWSLGARCWRRLRACGTKGRNGKETESVVRYLKSHTPSFMVNLAAFGRGSEEVNTTSQQADYWSPLYTRARHRHSCWWLAKSD